MVPKFDGQKDSGHEVSEFGCAIQLFIIIFLGCHVLCSEFQWLQSKSWDCHETVKHISRYYIILYLSQFIHFIYYDFTVTLLIIIVFASVLNWKFLSSTINLIINDDNKQLRNHFLKKCFVSPDWRCTKPETPSQMSVYIKIVNWFIY